MSAPPYGTNPYPPAAEDPGRTLGIVGLVLSFFTAIVGLVISAIALRQSKRAGFKNTPALIGVIVGAIGTLIGIILATVAIVALTRVAATCEELGPGTHEVNGTTYTCG